MPRSVSRMQRRRVRPRAAAPWVLALLLILGAGCQARTPMRIRPGPVVRESTIARAREFMEKVAVMPFYPETRSGRSIGGESESVGWESAALVAGFLADALAAEGIAVIPPNDLEVAFTGKGVAVPRLDARAAGEVAANSFGATAVVLGKVTRYREREGSAYGATRPASVAFEVSLYGAPSGRRLWTGRFDETQKSITEAILRARQYPGGGTRWLTAAEFARWGAGEIARSMTQAP